MMRYAINMYAIFRSSIYNILGLRTEDSEGILVFKTKRVVECGTYEFTYLLIKFVPGFNCLQILLSYPWPIKMKMRQYAAYYT